MKLTFYNFLAGRGDGKKDKKNEGKFPVIILFIRLGSYRSGSFARQLIEIKKQESQIGIAFYCIVAAQRARVRERAQSRPIKKPTDQKALN